MFFFRTLALFLSYFLIANLSSCSTKENEVNLRNQITSSPLTVSDYQMAEKFLPQNMLPLMHGDIRAVFWQEASSNGEEILVVRRITDTQSVYELINPATKKAEKLFDTEKLKLQLDTLVKQERAVTDLALSELVLHSSGEFVTFSYEGERFQFDLSGRTPPSLLEKEQTNEVVSPDGTMAVYIKDNNLWLRQVENGEVYQLTFDGVVDFGYATNNAGWIRDKTPVVKWSPDSKKIATFQHDGRKVQEMALWSTKIGHPEIDVWKYPLAGDENIFMIERVIIHVDNLSSPQTVRLNIPADPHRSSTSDHVAGSEGEFLDTQWSEDSSSLSFVSSSRDHKVAQLRTANIYTGEVREVYREETETYFESGFDGENWRVFHERGEFLWFSERSGWGHLYLHNLSSGEVIAQITTGEWPVLRLEKVDLKKNQLYFTAAGKNGSDPYFHALYRVNLDGRNFTDLTPEPTHHVLSWSNSKNLFVDKYSTPTAPPITVIRNTQGDVVMKLSEVKESDIRLRGWLPPEPFVVKARDDETDLYGLLYKPSNFDAKSRYPVLNYIYPGPQTGSVGTRAFQPARADKQAIAELGFIVVELDAMGTPGRSKEFHDAYYGNLGDNGLPDQIAGLKQLAEKFTWMDLDRVGVWGHSGGGFAAAAAILRYPDFYKVAVASAGNHDNRNYEDDWGEKWHGLLEVVKSHDKVIGENDLVQETNYDSQANQLLVDNLRGKLLLAHGMVDSNVHPSSTLLVVDALIKAEKDFDLILFPNAGHGFGNSRYFMKRRWDYFINHLSSNDSVSDFRFGSNIP